MNTQLERREVHEQTSIDVLSLSVKTSFFPLFIITITPRTRAPLRIGTASRQFMTMPEIECTYITAASSHTAISPFTATTSNHLPQYTGYWLYKYIYLYLFTFTHENQHRPTSAKVIIKTLTNSYHHLSTDAGINTVKLVSFWLIKPFGHVKR